MRCPAQGPTNRTPQNIIQQTRSPLDGSDCIVVRNGDIWCGRNPTGYRGGDEKLAVHHGHHYIDASMSD
jgi:hypothetical protein